MRKIPAGVPEIEKPVSEEPGFYFNLIKFREVFNGFIISE